MADDADAQLPQAAQDDTHANAPSGSSAFGELGDLDATVLTTRADSEAEEFPQRLSPRELALTLKGQLLGHFHLQEFVGGGGMGVVFKALDTTLDRIVAVKVVASQSISGEDLQRRFLVEAQSTARLDHPNIARIHYVGRDRGLPYIVFEYIDGLNLRDLVINHGPIPLGDALSFTTQIAHALAHAWQKEVVHRDIKPSNILVTREGQAKLVDMGLARVHQVATTENDLTNTGVTLGTFDYISPEQARDPREADTRSDIYSLGCTLFYMLAGRPPFPDGTAVQKLLQHQDQSPPSLSQVRPDVPESVSQLVLRMLEKSPELRPQTPSELVAACHEIFQELGLQPPASLPPLPHVQQPVASMAWRFHLPWAIPLTALLAVAIASSVGDFGPADSVEFQPLRSSVTPSTPAAIRTESPSVDSNALPSNRVEEATEPAAAANSEGGKEKQIDSSADLENPFTNSTSATSLLEFSASEPFQNEDSSNETADELDFDNILISE